MATLSLTNTFIAGTLAKASEVNQNFTDLINWSSGNIQNDNLGVMNGQITWSITTGVKAISIANSGNEGSISITQSVGLNPNKSTLRIVDSAAQTSGDAEVYLSMTSLSSTIPLLKADYAGSQVFAINKHRIELPVRTKSERDSISPSNGSIVFVEDSPTTRHRGIHVKTSEGWSNIMPSGVMVPFAGANVPDGWLLCDGSAVSRTTYATLFAAISTNWGVGDGSTTFNLPDMRRRAAIGSGGSASFGPSNGLGATGGNEGTTLSITHMPSHNHGGGVHNHSTTEASHQHIQTLSDTAADSSSYAPYGIFGHSSTAMLGHSTNSPRNLAYTSAASTGLSVNNSGTVISSEGSGTQFSNMPPSAVVTYIIKF